ncbi:LLM class flavin-dependent oxidoreductase [Catenuloplanes sp. NPDC051500]|uniref:LLM class flavin-dependent oxidoreductase n=1 Tax=Catenuloplanes sp. NPDC051500 TaxID=3363959 RepID=UPI0037B3CBD7
MIHLAVALDSAADPDARFTLDYWTGLIAEAERGLLDFVTIEDPPSHPAGAPAHRLDAVLVAAASATATRHIGLVPTAALNHAQPLKVAREIATLDHLTGGRAGWRTQQTPARPIPREELFTPAVQEMIAERFDRAAELVRVVRALWDGVTEEEKLRELAPERFADEWYTITDPSTAPRAPQGHPVLFTLAHITVPFRFAARAVDVVSVTPHDAASAAATLAEVRELQAEAGRAAERLHVFADLVVFLGEGPDRGFASDAHIVTGDAAGVADLIEEWHATGLSGFRLRPGRPPADVTAITRELVPELQRRGLFRTAYPEAASLRTLLGLDLPL